ncbi:MAG: fructose 1,6-bisphosphatase, partial [Deltaproteobacteria bacterium]|nr:fructose 1,6-bisphosphatase [Deltaproteobacteria bacterium]
MANGKKITISVIKADVGGFVGHSSFHPALLDMAKEKLGNAKDKGVVADFHVIRCGDDLELIMTHDKGCDNKAIHELAWNIFTACTEAAKELKLYGAGQDLLKDAFTGTVKGMGPGVAEMEFVERKSEPVIVFMADKTSSGAWNLPLYKIFGDPFNTAGLVIDPSMADGFCFNVLDVKENKSIMLSCPEETYCLLALIGATSRYMITSVYRKKDKEITAVASTERLGFIAGKYVGKD